MLDLKFIRENPDLVKAGVAAKGFDAHSVDELLPLSIDAGNLLMEIETLRAERNKVAAMGPDGAARGREIKQELEGKEETYREKNARVQELMLQLPNLPEPGVPIGEGESANRVVKTVGDIPVMDNPQDHVSLMESLDLLDIERGVKVAESRFTFLKNQAVLLEFALIRLALDIAMKHGFTPMITPELVNGKTVTGTGYLPYGADEVYKTQDDLYLIGTSELALVGYHQDEVLDLSQGPKRYVGFSSCFRREAGSYGKDMRGMFRTHQFDKVEMVSFTKPEDSANELNLILSIEEEIMQTLGLPYHILEIGSGDLGMQAAKKYDVEAWLPGQNKYRETHSCSNTTDFQSRRLNIRYKRDDGKNECVHTLNGTAIAMSRLPIAIIENGQQPDGSIVIPDALVPYCGFSTIS